MSHRDKMLYTKGWKDYSFNEYVSRIISIRRQLSDARDPAIKENIKAEIER
ncbi:hypothetical protein KUTeg_008836 [Tegillarca granosa]|uniref:Uncharacterized protein n=1 Tax=Tegillarca granosa TaxID=220873 RepID=A0ABQ9FDA8_TEGGR|nr:hypothetical protein KUTeg_008836 [Tegillarca granosa]